MALPIQTTADDVRGIINYFKNKPTGATGSEARPILKQVADSRKISAYVQWGLVSREGERLKLTVQGWQLARNPAHETQVFRSVLDRIQPYRSALEWFHHQSLTQVTNVDVAAFWHDNFSGYLGTTNDNTIKDNAVCFFHVCEGAGLGKLTIGRRSKPTRLDIRRDDLREFIEAGPATPPWSPPATDDVSEEIEESESLQTAPEPLAQDSLPATPSVAESARVFISHGKNREIVDQVQTMLGLADIESAVAEAEETTAIPVPEKVFNAMRSCSAGVIVVSADDENKDDTGQFRLNENVLIEIGAAFVLYDKRVVLVWDKRLNVPSNLQGLYRCEYEGDELSWSAGMKLMKAIQQFKK